MSPPLVSVRVITYNHEPYIAQCIEGVLMQRTDFPFEVIIGEDCSTDRTREIVFAYGEKYPESIRVITAEKNVGGYQNVLRVQQACRGKYHAHCEGDDYWIDPLKLQKQVDFMETHPEYSMCFHDAFVVRHDKSALPGYYLSPAMPERMNISDLICLRRAVPTASILARSEILSTLPEWRKDIRYGDLLVRLWCAHYGDLKNLGEVMSVYRNHPDSMTKSNRSLDLHYSSIVDIYNRFDAETTYRYSDSIKQAIQEIQREYRFELARKKVGRLAFFLYPDKATERLQTYANLRKQYKQRYNY